MNVLIHLEPTAAQFRLLWRAERCVFALGIDPKWLAGLMLQVWLRLSDDERAELRREGAYAEVFGRARRP